MSLADPATGLTTHQKVGTVVGGAQLVPSAPVERER
jgi:hypothetical protein